MKKLIILIEIIILILLIYVGVPKPGNGAEQRYFFMTATSYSNHHNCIADKWRDGLTAMGTPIREGVVAINVDYIDGKWIVKSPLKLGDKIYIEEMGYFSVEDTGYFTENDLHFDFWNLDIYMENYEEAKKFGRKLIKVYVIEEGVE